jgi:hyperosmotically inducible periplasmic protein
MKKIVISGIVAVLATALIGCESTNSNVVVNGNKVSNNTAVVVNSNTNVVNTAINTNTKKELTREEFDKDKAKYEAEAKESKSTIGTGANDLWLWTKARTALAGVDDLRDSTINVDVNNAVVTLRGTVGSADQKAAAEKAAKVDGVTSVKNDLKVDAKDSMTNQMTSGNGAKTNTNANKK